TWIVTSWPLLLINCAAIALSPPVLEPWGQYRSLSHFCKAPPGQSIGGGEYRAFRFAFTRRFINNLDIQAENDILGKSNI
ncbi:hypothetical protein, partial [uncultured Thiocystis sp.]|uniref:hypothetical protein n=1 Tax=uncultured Thiocystis sp. TaxID=1202134 RepID=UPI0025EA4E3E